MQHRVISALHAVLDAERAALLGANYGTLGPIAASKEQLLGQLSSTSDQMTGLQEIKTRIAANQALLRAAINGVAAAKARVAALQNVRDELGIYDQTGKLEKAVNCGGSLEKKA